MVQISMKVNLDMDRAFLHGQLHKPPPIPKGLNLLDRMIQVVAEQIEIIPKTRGPSCICFCQVEEKSGLSWVKKTSTGWIPSLSFVHARDITSRHCQMGSSAIT